MTSHDLEISFLVNSKYVELLRYTHKLTLQELGFVERDRDSSLDNTKDGGGCASDGWRRR